MNVNITRELYDHHDDVDNKYQTPEGLNEKTVRTISKYKNEPEWMLNKRLDALKIFNELKMPNWGPDLEKLDLQKITYLMVPNAQHNSKSWDDVPQNIKNTFERLGIPEAERKALAGVGAQYDSQVVYHNIKEELSKQGVIFEDMDIAVHKYPEMIKKYFMNKCVNPKLHKFVALHGAVWTGGTYIFVPKNVKVELPLQAYFRMNTKSVGQFEHTLIIVDEGAEVHYIEGCFTKNNIITCNPEYKKIVDIAYNDRVLTSEGRYRTAGNLQVRPYTGKIYKIQISGDPTQKIEVTADHPFLYVDKTKHNEKNKKFISRWNIPKYFKIGDYLAMPINKIEESNKFKEFIVKKREKNKWIMKKINIPLINEFFRLVGYYLSEGSISSGYYLNFSFNINEKEYIDDVKYCLKKVFNITKIIESEHKKNHGLSLVICSVELARIFEWFGKGNSNKSLPIWAMIETKEHQAEIIKSWFYGDGNYYKKKHASGLKEIVRINTTSEKLARQGRDILLRLDIVAFINNKDRSKENRKTMYTLGISGVYMHKFGKIVGLNISDKINLHNRASMFGIDKKFAYVPIKNILVRDVHNLPVYNFSVKDDETYTVNGVVAHNCSAPLYNTNSLHVGCVEIFVHKNARMRYSSVENWSKNTFNLNTKSAIVEENAIMEWVSANLGSGYTMLYPSSILVGKNAKADHISIAYAGSGQNQDTGTKVYHLAENTSSTIKSKSISKDGGITTYRGLVKIAKGAINSKCSVSCDALMFDNESQSNTYPSIDVEEQESDVVHEATVGKISESQIFYLQSRGLSAEQAVKMIVSGFIEPLVKELPLEYAVEMNRLIELEIEGKLG